MQDHAINNNVSNTILQLSAMKLVLVMAVAGFLCLWDQVGSPFILPGAEAYGGYYGHPYPVPYPYSAPYPYPANNPLIDLSLGGGIAGLYIGR